jgi:aspartyl/glutamyl-tRNA(Asn/Gln) amidotransferase C subunit
MTKDEIRTLGSLSRIALSDAEVETFNQEIDSILEYVSVVTKIAEADTKAEPAVGVRYNVLREDAVTNTPGSYTKAMLAEMPKTNGQYLSVKKILKQAE